MALVTPMKKDGSLDKNAFKRLIDWHIESGTSALVVVGTTGESPSVDFNEHVSLIELAVSHSARRIAIIAGTGANSTSEAILLTKEAKKIGVDASIQVVPYYNKPTQSGLYRHFYAIAESVDLPIILYNVPGRTVADLSNDTVLKLSEIKNIIGIKDATSDIGRAQWLLRELPADFLVFSGDDITAIALMMLGGAGNISVTANVIPRVMANLCRNAMEGDVKKAIAMNKILLPLHSSLFLEANPIPVKWLMFKMGLIEEAIRLPLSLPDEKTKRRLVEMLELIDHVNEFYFERSF